MDLNEIIRILSDIRSKYNCFDEEDEECYRGLSEAIKMLCGQQWIPCSERLPEGKRKEYWVCTDTGYQCECRWTNVNHLWTDLTTDWHWHIMDIPRYTEVVAWMPLPDPWKGDYNAQDCPR